MADLTTSDELRETVRERYAAELEGVEATVGVLRKKGREGTVTLLYASRDQEHNSALVLKRYLVRRS